MIYRKINWNGFLKRCIEDYPNEALGTIFSEDTYTEKEEWHIYPQTNIHKKPKNNFKWEGKEWKETLKIAKALYQVYIGTIHTHPYPENNEFDKSALPELLLPSKKDIRGASSKFLLVAGIIVCDNKKIYGIRFHNPFGINEIPIHLISFDKESKKIPLPTVGG